MIWLCSLALALAPVTEPLGEGSVDWTRLQLVATATGEAPGGSITSHESMEAEARRQLGPAFVRMARELRVTSTLLAGELLDAGNSVSDRLGSNLSLWEVQEARYFTSGKIELEAALPLQHWLRPALVSLAHGKEREAPPTSTVTGLVVNARGLDLSPAVAPQLLGPDGRVLYAIDTLTEDAASTTGPVVYVRDPADPLGVARAGAEPLFVHATDVRAGCDLELSAADFSAIQAAADEAPFLLHGKVVVVIGP